MPAFYLQQLIAAQRAPVSQTTMFTASAITRIDSISVTNTDTAVHTISINLVTLAGTASAANLTTDLQPIQPGQTWNSPNEVGKVLNSGDFISVIASTASVLTIAAGGLLMTL
jgi:hypothetical protein